MRCESLAAAFEDDHLRKIAEQLPINGADGTAWIFRKEVGGRVLEYHFWQPTDQPERESSQLAFALAQRFADLAGHPNLVADERRGAVSRVQSR